MNLGGVCGTSSSTFEIKKEAEDTLDDGKCLNRKAYKNYSSRNKKETREVAEQEIMMKSISDLNHDVCNLLIFRKIHLMKPHQVSCYLDSVGVSADQMRGQIDRLQNMLSETRALVVQSSISSTSTQINKPVGASQVDAPESETSESSESEDDSSSGETDSYVSSNYMGDRRLHKRRHPDSFSAEFSHPKVAKKSKMDSVTVSRLSQGGTMECKVSLHRHLMSNTKSKTDSTSKSTYKPDEDLKIPRSLGELVDHLLNIINTKREEIEFPQDIMTFWLMLNSDTQDSINDIVKVHGGNIKEFLMAAIVSGQSGLEAMRSLQKKIDQQEDKISLVELDQLTGYLRKEVFNERKVGFSFDHLAQMMRLMKEKGGDKFLNTLPPRLCFLVECLVSQVILVRTSTDASIRFNDFKKLVLDVDGVLKKYSIGLLKAVCGNKRSVSEIHALQDKLEGCNRNDFSVSEKRWKSSKDRYLTKSEAKQLKEYFTQNFFQKWLLRFSSEHVRKSMKTAPKWGM